ncbi:carboxyl-terminal-processing peptidase 2, chloroplastic isoform X2 [Physcomitrium patens]|uniref:C-terminal processing peptidase n=1 Tax=Physcomitrium patens TaxID=3218 RepID=A0A7I4ENH7_PHYPA|nr:carboxyl-terminal-processing peptidase 2, chloroplastic-like isoform X2 [Physcomitrium patens]|eukprot:XP_024385319.1 carboxyl-terminal-processing peptidase 2, chloroplastic-like isoform X2 [Physcomitrella patens]
MCSTLILNGLAMRKGPCRAVKESVESARVFLRQNHSVQVCLTTASSDRPNELSGGASLLCGWGRKQRVTALRWGRQLWCLPAALESFDAGEVAEQLSHWQASIKRRGLVFILSSLIVTGALASFALQPSLSLTEENLLFLEAWRTVDRAYVDKSFNGQSWFRYREDALKKEPMKTREETYAAIRKMLATLDDPFTRFLEPEKFKSLQSGTNGAVTGVGLEVGFNTSDSSTSNTDLVVVSPVSGGPAARAGVLPGDVITAIDGVPTHGMGLYDAARRLQGPVQSQVELTLLKKDATTPSTITVLREKITLNPVTWRLCEMKQNDGSAPLKLGYIRLSTFNQNSSSAVKKAIETLQESGAAAFILDIRNNSGGLFPSGVEIAKMWLDKGVIVYIADSMGVRDIYDTDGDSAISTKEPLAVLVNKGTASASEILAGALKDNKRAVILGEPTFGKGRIQSVFQLSDGSGMAVTIARYETPAHINIDKVGITPDRPLPAVLPMDEEAFCRCIEDPNADCNVSFTSLFSR